MNSLSMGRRYVLNNYVALDIVGLNSSMLEQKRLAGYGFVGTDQVNEAATAMRWTTEKNRATYRILVMHHHIVAVAAEEDLGNYDKNYSLTLDAGQLIYGALELGVDLVSHGHMHQPFASAISR
ncbi:MAG TPA: metallophosphoesterase, partial [Blastocatellia bacterium]